MNTSVIEVLFRSMMETRATADRHAKLVREFELKLDGHRQLETEARAHIAATEAAIAALGGSDYAADLAAKWSAENHHSASWHSGGSLIHVS